MLTDFLNKIKEWPRIKLLIVLLTAWQYLSIAGIAMLNWPNSLIWLNLGLLLGFILLSPIYESLLLLILSIPFSVAIPNFRFEGLPMWRVLFFALFIVWLVRDKKYLLRRNFFQKGDIVFLPWDKYLAAFTLLGIVLAFPFGVYRTEALKLGFFWFNIYCFYLVLVNALKGKQQIFELIRYVIWSLAIIITLGFTQLIGTFLTDLDTFWVYWATNVTKLYYGANFSNVVMYSNSWFSYSGARELRMFSIMPDSQSFAYICLIALCMGTALTRSVFQHVKKWLWSGIRFAGMALILSGTRAAWVGMIAPFTVVAWAYYKNFQKHLAKKFLWPFVIIFLLFIISPFINQGLAYLQVEKFHENFLLRAESIYNLQEASNQGRIDIWKNSAHFAVTHLWGVGLGNFLLSFSPQENGSNYSEVSQQINKRYNLPAKYVSAHSLYLQVLVETGIVGFMIFTAFWVSVLRYFWKFIKHYKNTEDFLVYFVAQAFLVVLWILAAAFFDITLLNDKVLMYFLIDLGLAGLVVKRYHDYQIDE